MDKPVQTYIIILDPIILDPAKPAHPENRGAKMAELLETLADIGTFGGIEDPIARQREQRKDRPMPFRDYHID